MAQTQTQTQIQAQSHLEAIPTHTRSTTFIAENPVPSSINQFPFSPTGPTLITIGLNSTKIYSPANPQETHYEISQTLNQDAVNGNLTLSHLSHKKQRVYNINAISTTDFAIAGSSPRTQAHGILTLTRKFGLTGRSWEVKDTPTTNDPSQEIDLENDDPAIILRAKGAKSGANEDNADFHWCDADRRVIATDTKLVRTKGSDAEGFEMPVLKISEGVGEHMRDLVVACWVARVWVDVVGAKKSTLRRLF